MNVFDFREQAFWSNHFPQLNICNVELFRAPPVLPVEDTAIARLVTDIKVDGYVHGSVGDWGLNINHMAETVRSMAALNIPPVFAFVFDEFWLIFRKLDLYYRTLLSGDYAFLPDFWVWNVDPQKKEAGWTPHRDRGRIALFEDGTPKSLTTWIPLSAATPLNGCIYVLPASEDQTYATADEQNWRPHLPSIRALPAKPGDFLIWNQALLHWGGKTSPQASESRVSLAFEVQRADVPPLNQPLLRPSGIISFGGRLQLIAAQLLQYRHMYQLSDELTAFSESMFKQ